MLKRYPHIGKIKISKETDNGTSTPDIAESEIEVKGRYEPGGQNKALDYSAKFYCKPNSIPQFDVDGQKFIFEGKQFKIVQLHNYQSHCEIWLE
ncbi:MAG: hypothetical protein V3V28_09350 [Polaribacter sp.]|uniref:hypothetical protein n=1 Tax=Polaribacter sp. TaxID=1920175 RepID=UPI002F350268